MNSLLARKKILAVSGVVLAVGIGGGALFWNAHHDIQLVQDSLPEGAINSKNLAVRGEGLYWWGVQLPGLVDEELPKFLRLYSQPLHGGRVSTLFEVPYQNFGDIVFGPNEILLLTQTKMSLPDYRNYKYTGAGGRTSYYRGPVRVESETTNGSEVLVKIVPRYSPTKVPAPILTRFPYSMSGQKNAGASTALDVNGFALADISYQLTAPGLYWLRPGVNEQRLFLYGGQRYIGRPARDTLVFTEWDGKSSDLLTHCLLTQAGKDADQVYWQTIDRPFAEAFAPRWDSRIGEKEPPQPLPNLLTAGNTPPDAPFHTPQNPRATTATSQAERLNRITLFNATHREFLVNGANRREFAGRYYWFEGPAAIPDAQAYGLPGRSDYTDDSIFSPQEPPVLISARRDGSDRKTLMSMRDQDNIPVLPRALLTDGKGLYLVFRRAESRKAPDRTGGNYFVRIYPDRPGKFWGKSIRLPDCVLQGPMTEPLHDGFFYFMTRHYRRQPLDFLQENSTEKQITSLWRVRLPE